MLSALLVLAFGASAAVCSMLERSGPPQQIRLVKHLLDMYDKKAKPVWNAGKPINVSFSMDLYQILELNEPQQYILLNAWIIERWFDEFLVWDPLDFDNITELRLPYDSIWLPDTTLYNSLVMKDEDSRRLLNAKVTVWPNRTASYIELLYPTIYKFSCLLNLRFFPFDVQVCTMIFSSWTYDQTGIDYFPHSEAIGVSNYLENEGWYILHTEVRREEVKYECCPNLYTLLKMTLVLRRKPLFYLVNLIIPTSIITLIAIVGFFTTSSASGMREEKVSLGITTLLSMSILMLMVSDQMPTTSSFIPLIGWFILAMIIVISLGTVVSSVIIAVQKRGRLGQRLSKRAMRFTRMIANLTLSDIPPHIEKELALEDDVRTPLPLGPPETKPLKDLPGHAGVKWLSLRNRPANGLSLMSSEKSTDALIHPSPKAFTPVSPIGLASMDDDNSLGGDSISSKPPTGRSFRPQPNNNGTNNNNASATSGPTNLASALRLNRQLAQIEYEWFATVLERMCFSLFVICFLIITFGINLVGFVHWHKAGLNADMLKDVRNNTAYNIRAIFS